MSNMSNTETKIEFEAGCYLPELLGHYIASATILFAIENGWTGDDATAAKADSELYVAVVNADKVNDDDVYKSAEGVHSSCDLALEWLNENCAPDGLYWDLNDGLMLSPIEDD